MQNNPIDLLYFTIMKNKNAMKGVEKMVTNILYHALFLKP